MSLNLDPNAVCAACGHFGAYLFETEALCAECYSKRGACCSAEFEGHPPECHASAAPKPIAAPAASPCGYDRC